MRERVSELEPAHVGIQGGGEQRRREREREPQADPLLSTEPVAGLDPMTLVS